MTSIAPFTASRPASASASVLLFVACNCAGSAAGCTVQPAGRIACGAAKDVQDVPNGPGCPGWSRMYRRLLSQLPVPPHEAWFLPRPPSSDPQPSCRPGWSRIYRRLLSQLPDPPHEAWFLPRDPWSDPQPSCRLVSCDLEDTGQRTGARVLVTKKTSKRRNSFIS